MARQMVQIELTQDEDGVWLASIADVPVWRSGVDRAETVRGLAIQAASTFRMLVPHRGNLSFRQTNALAAFYREFGRDCTAESIFADVERAVESACAAPARELVGC